MTSTSFNVGLNTATRNSSKVLKPPGGGSSDIFGVADANEPQRGRRNHNISSFSLGTEEVVTPARKPGNDSFYNLFGTNEPSSRPSTAAKDKFRSNIILESAAEDDNSTTAKKTLFTQDTETVDGQNDNQVDGETNGNGLLSEDSQSQEDQLQKDELNLITESKSNGITESNAGGDSSSTNGSTSSIESTPAPTPTPSGGASAPAKQRVPPGGFSSGLW